MRKSFRSHGFITARLAVGAAVIAGMLHAAPTHAAGSGDHAHDSASSGDTSAGGHDAAADMNHGDTHAHEQWAEPPAAYAKMDNPDWKGYATARRGAEIYIDNCASCHGVDGRGTGPAAEALDHPPADLTNHFHRGPGLGDGYLFWRVSEGGQVEPFKSQGSAMPAFKSVLSKSERWDVLTYVHQLFHNTNWNVHDPDNVHGDSTAHTD